MIRPARNPRDLAAKEPDRGSVLIATLLAMALMTVLGGALVLITMTETKIAAKYRDGVDMFYAADAALELAVQELAKLPDWDAVLGGVVTSAVTDGPPSGERSLMGGTTLNLTAVTNQVRCGKAEACSEADLLSGAPGQVWGANNPRWQLFVYGRLEEMLPGSVRAPAYVAVWVGDDLSEIDGNPLQDGTFGAGPGHGRVELLAHAFGSDGARRILEATVARAGLTGEGWNRVRVLSWREIR